MRQFEENTNAYIDAVCKEIRWKKAHEPVKRELSAHIEDQAAAFIASGMSESEAEARAVAEMGDPVTTGMKLDASYRPKSLLAVFIPLGVVLLLCVLSKFTVYGAYMTGREWVEFIAALIIGGGAFAALLQVNLDHFIRLSPYTVGAALLGMFLWRYVAFPVGNRGTGALNYAVCVLPVLVAALACSLRGKGVWAVLICGGCVAVAELVLLTLPSAANGFALALACLFMLTLAIAWGMFGKQKAAPLAVLYSGAALGGGSVIACIGPYSIERIRTVFDPTLNETSGWFALRVREALASSKFAGAGASTTLTEQAGFSALFDGNRVYTLNDFMLTTVIYRYGWLFGALATLALFALIAVGFYKAFKLKSRAGKLIACAILASIAVQALCYTLCNLGIIIGTPLPLPFISSGNTALVINLAMMGLLMSLLRTDGLYTDTEAKPTPKLRIRLEWEG